MSEEVGCGGRLVAVAEIAPELLIEIEYQSHKSYGYDEFASDATSYCPFLQPAERVLIRVPVSNRLSRECN